LVFQPVNFLQDAATLTIFDTIQAQVELVEKQSTTSCFPLLNIAGTRSNAIERTMFPYDKSTSQLFDFGTSV
jgi:hypothetical protein